MLAFLAAAAFARTGAQLATLAWLQLTWTNCQARQYTAPGYSSVVELTCELPTKRRFIVYPDGSYL